MTERKKLLLRLDPDIYAAVARWASDDLRSVNAQIEYALRRALEAAGRAPRRAPQAETEGSEGEAQGPEDETRGPAGETQGEDEGEP